jgi:GT2 family glycosyltransferase
LDSINNQDFPNDNLDIIIADGMSKDGTRDIIKRYESIFPNFTILDNPERFVPIGFNIALSEALGGIIIRLDGHSEIKMGFIKNCIRLINETGADCVGGTTSHIAKGIVGHSINIAQSSYFGVGGVAFRKSISKGRYVDTLAFGAYKRSIFEKIGGYDEELIRNQDDEFNFRLIQNGGRIWLDPSIKSTYYPRTSLVKLFKQYYQYGFYKVRVIQKRRGFSSWRHLVPGIFVFVLLASFISSILSSKTGSFYLLIISYLIANLISTFWTALKYITDNNTLVNWYRSLATILLLPITFFTLHFSYGLGFLCGLVYFWNKWGDNEVKDYHFNRVKFMKNSEEIRINKII